MRRIFNSVQRITLRNFKPLCIRALGLKSEKVTKSGAVNNILTSNVSPNHDEIGVARQVVIPPISEASLHVVSTAAGQEIVKSKSLAWGGSKPLSRKA